MKSLGRHCVSEVFGVSNLLLDDVEYLCNLLEVAVKESGATLLDMVHHHFEPCGVTIVCLLAESHCSIHTWPEKQCASLDFYTCGTCEPNKAMDYIIKELKPKEYNLKVFDR